MLKETCTNIGTESINDANCHTPTYAFLNAEITTNKNLVEYNAGCCETSCIGAYFRVKNNFTIKFDCCDRNNCNDLKALHSLEYKCEFNKSIPSFSSLVYPVENTKAAGVKMCYMCKDCIYPTRNVEIEYCGKKNNQTTTYACQYIYGHSMQEKFWSGGCIPIEDFYLSSHRDLNVKV